MKINPDHDPYRSLKFAGVFGLGVILAAIVASRNNPAPTIADKNLAAKTKAWQDSLIKYEGHVPSEYVFKKERMFHDSLAKYDLHD